MHPMRSRRSLGKDGLALRRMLARGKLHTFYFRLSLSFSNSLLLLSMLHLSPLNAFTLWNEDSAGTPA